MKLKLPQHIEKFDFYVDQLRKHDGIVELKKVLGKRTLQQNKYLHVLISLFAIEAGYTLDEMKVYLKRGCSFMMYEKKGDKYLKSSSQLNTKELTDWIEWIRNYAGTIGIYLPSAEDYHRNWTEIEMEIEANKKYL